jgi:hypothetical protein
MGNYSVVNGFPWVDIKTALGAVNAFIGKLKQRFFGHMIDNPVFANWF